MKRYYNLIKTAGKIKLSFDKGNNSNKNFKLISDNEYIGSLVPSSYDDLTAISLEDYTKSYKDCKVYECVKEVFDRGHKIFITYNESLHLKQKNSFLKQKEKAKRQLEEEFEKHKTKEDLTKKLYLVLHTYKIGQSRACRYLDYEIKGEEISIIEDEEEIRKKEKVFGKNIIFTNNLTAGCFETIKSYKDKIKVEDSFKTIHDHRIISLHPIWHWTDTKIRMDAFISILAYLLIKLLQYLAKEGGLEMSVASLITALKGIREVLLVYPDHTTEKKLEEQAPLQQQLLHKFGLMNID